MNQMMHYIAHPTSHIDTYEAKINFLDKKTMLNAITVSKDIIYPPKRKFYDENFRLIYILIYIKTINWV